MTTFDTLSAANLGRILLCSSAIAILAPALPAYGQAQDKTARRVEERTVEFAIPALPIAAAIARYSAQSGVNVLAGGVLPPSVRTSPVNGRFTPAEALDRMLAGTGYSYGAEGSNSIVLIGAGAAAPSDDGATRLKAISAHARMPTLGGLVAGKDAPYETAAAVSSMDGETLQERYAGNVDNALRSGAGTFTRKAMSGAGVAVNIRGMEGYGRVNMTIDGARQNIRVMGHGVSGGSTFVDSDLLAGMDIGRGALGGAAGVGALGGAANFRTLGIDDVVAPGRTAGALSTVKFGNNEYGWSTMAAAGMRTDTGIGFMGAFNRRDSGSPLSGVDDRGRRIIATDLAEDLKSGLVKLELGNGDDHRLLLGGVWYNNHSSIRAEPQVYRNQTYTARYDYAPGDDLVNLTVNAYLNDSSVRFVEGNYKGRFTRDRGLGIDVTNRSELSLSDDVALALSYGGAYYHDDVSNGQPWGTGGPGDGQIGVGSLFADATFTYGIFELTPGFHFDTFDLRGDVAKRVGSQNVIERIERSENSFNPRVTLAATPWDGIQFYTRYAKTSRPPSVTETFFPGAHGSTPNPTSPNPNLKGETSLGWEVGVNILSDGLLGEGDSLRVKANYFSNDVENYITSAARPSGPPYVAMLQFVNVPGKTRIEGFELEAQYDTGQIFGGITYSNTKTHLPYGMWSDGFGVGEINGLPEDTLTINAGFRALEEKLTVSGQVRHVGKTKGVKPPMGPDLIEFDSYTLVDAFATYKFNDNATLFLNVENLANTAYKPAHYLDKRLVGRGRTVMGGLTVKF